jgi:hypothetical protein
MRTVLVSLPSGAGLVRDDDDLILITNDVAVGRSGTYLREEAPLHPAKHWVNEDQCVVGGILPPGAASADVVDDRGIRVAATVARGAYAALLDQPTDGHEPIVCCRDAAGEPIRRPWPNDYPSVRVTDAQEPCPACGALDYDEYVPFEQWRGGRGGPNATVIPNPVVSCRVCGHDEPEGTFVHFGSGPGDHEDMAEHAARIAQARAEMRQRQWRSAEMTLRDTRFPIYAAEGWPAQLGGSGSQGADTTEITITHHDTPVFDPFAGDQPRLEITTKHDDSLLGDLYEARQTLDNWLHADNSGTEWPDVSNAALTLWLRARDRRRRAALLRAERTAQLITIDAAPTPALMLMTGRRWVAVARQRNLTIVIAGHEIDPGSLHLKPITDPLAQLLGPQPPDG